MGGLERWAPSETIADDRIPGRGALTDPEASRLIWRGVSTLECKGGIDMTAEQWALAASVFFSGLAAGFLGGLCTIVRPMQAAMTGPEFRNFMGAFLPVAKHGGGLAFNMAWSLGMFLSPIVALVLLWDDTGSTSFVLTAIGLAIVFVGVILVSNLWKTPTYNVILGWDPDAMPTGWEAGRRTYFTINWLQMATTWAAFLLFLVALIELS